MVCCVVCQLGVRGVLCGVSVMCAWCAVCCVVCCVLCGVLVRCAWCVVWCVC